MKSENKNRMLLTLNKPDHSINRIREIAAMQKGKSFDLLHVTGTDPNGTDYFPLEELSEIADEIPKINKCYSCDVTGLIETLKETVDPELLLAEYQVRHIVMTLILAYWIKAKGYDETIFYHIYTDHRLTEIPAKTILNDPECFCLTKEIENNSPADLYAKRFFVSQALSFSDHRPEYSYSMSEKEIRKLCRKVKRSHFLDALKFEEIDFRNIK